jgi:hypothetical protein
VNRSKLQGQPAGTTLHSQECFQLAMNNIASGVYILDAEGDVTSNLREQEDVFIRKNGSFFPRGSVG